MKFRVYFPLFICCVLFCYGNSYAEDRSSAIFPHLKVELKADHGSELANPILWVEFELEKGWHIYGQNPGDIGLPTKIKLNVPKEIRALEADWPATQKFESEGLTSFGYEEKLILGHELLLAEEELFGGVRDLSDVNIEATIEWVLCRDECIPGKVVLNKSTDLILPTNVATKENRAGRKGAVAEDRSFILTLCFAFIGGFLLNLMPCVFPVISLKILSFVNQSNKNSALGHGVVFAMGIIISFWLLSGFLFIARAIGSEVGWGFQFQSPTFVVLIGFLLFAVGLNFLGVFDIGLGVQRVADSADKGAGYVGSFFSGVLSTLLATPCSAPFMASAIAGSFVLPVWMGFLVFTFIGLGMSVPYLILSAFPNTLKFLPKPGNWMLRLKQIMAFPMFATVIWLIWVLSIQTGSTGVVFFLSGLLILSIGLWMLGQWCHPGASDKHRRLAMYSCAIAFAVAVLVALPKESHANYKLGTRVNDNGDDVAQMYTEAKLNQLIADKKPVLVEFSAAWCLTCQVNHLLLYRSGEAKQALREKGVVLLDADWTNRDPVITRAIKSLGREGVPLNVLYIPGRQEATVLPQVLTLGGLTEALNEIPS